MDPSVYGNGYHQQPPFVHGQASNSPSTPSVGGQASHQYSAYSPGGNGQAAANATNSSGFGVRGRNDRIILLDDKIVHSVENQFKRFKGLFLTHYAQRLGTSQLMVDADIKVSVDMNTRIVTVEDSRGVVTNIALSSLQIPQGQNRQGSAEYEMTRLVQDMGNELVNAGAMSKMEQHQAGRDFNHSQRHGVGAVLRQNGFSNVMGRVGEPTKERMSTPHLPNGFTTEERNALLGETNPPSDQAIDEIKERVKFYVAQLLSAVLPQDDVKRKKLEEEIALLKKQGLRELIAMVRARVENDLPDSSILHMTDGQIGELKQNLAQEYLKGVKAYFETQRAQNKMGTDTKGGVVLSPADEELATLIVATAVFAGAVDRNGEETDDYKQGYHKFMQSNGYTQNKNLGAIGLVFSAMQVDNAIPGQGSTIQDEIIRSFSV